MAVTVSVAGACRRLHARDREGGERGEGDHGDGDGGEDRRVGVDEPGPGGEVAGDRGEAGDAEGRTDLVAGHHQPGGEPDCSWRMSLIAAMEMATNIGPIPRPRTMKPGQDVGQVARVGVHAGQEPGAGGDDQGRRP